MEFTINSKKLGRELTFSRPGQGYIFVDLNGRPGTLGEQICSGGHLLGSTLSYRGDEWGAFAAKCRRWYRQHLAKHGSEYSE